jgi:regulator of sigma E protease
VELLGESILPFVGILVALIVIHEAGHYFTAKLFGVKVLEAGLGYPPRVWGFKRGETEYTVNALPLGGFVRLLGEEDPSDPRSLAAQPKWKRAVVLASGAFMNLVLAIALFSLTLMIPREVVEGQGEIAGVTPNSPAARADLRPGDKIVAVNGREAETATDAFYLVRLHKGSTIDLTIRRTDPRTGTETLVVPVKSRLNPEAYTDECGVERPAGSVGIQIGTSFGQQSAFTPEELERLERQSTEQMKDYQEQIAPGAPAACYSSRPADGLDFGFVALTAPRCAELTPDERAAAAARKRELFPNSDAACYDFDPGPKFVPFTKMRSDPPWEAVPNATRLAYETLIMTKNEFVAWADRGFGPSTSPFGGPVAIAQTTGIVVDEAGWVSLIEFSALLSMSLAILNILPIPMLDGGRLLFVFIEFLRGGRRIAPEKEALVHLVGLAMILTLVVMFTYNDIARILRGEDLLR